ncbi:MAG TPA: MASE1 domain-containing protein, partial [Steroidobacteraceae bacterium]|nr:MASE1 domain-containing protein [Steroidobacteraceae bacterium]
VMNRLLRPFGLKLGPLQAGAIYFPLHFLAVGIGLTLLIAPQGVGVFWPATGSLFAFLLLYPTRYWLALLTMAFVAELSAHEIFAPQIPYTVAGLLFFVKFLAGVLGVGLMHIGVRGPISFARLRHVLCFAAAALLSTLACAIAAVGLRGGTSLAIGAEAFWLAVQNWWIGDFLGALVITPLLLTVGIHGFALTSSVRGGRLATYSAFAVLLILLGAVFLHKTGVYSSPLDVPYIVYPVLVWIAMLSGPRRTALAAGITVAFASLATTRGLGPFESPYQLQTFLALCVLPVLLLQAVMAERDSAIAKARASDERYRAFVANSSEAIFRTELAEPMPVTMSPDEQIAWVRKHGFVAECNTAFMVALGVKDVQSAVVGTRLGDHPTWSKIYIERIREAIRNGYQVRNIEHVVHGPYGLDRVLLISMIGIVENGHVIRFWGSGRDVTAMREAEHALAQHDSQLRALATEITLAEERARRKLASELHDGPAQNLIGLGMQLAAIKRGVEDREQLQRLDECEQVLADATLQTRTLMLELAPPGLHESGLLEALRWLADRVAKQQRLIVSVEDDGIQKPLEDQVTVLLFQTVRELLQNVVKHARSKRATVRCAVSNEAFALDVIDPGVGFEVHSIDRLPTRHGGFGLFNIRERLKLMGGSVDIHSVVGEGTTVRIRVPLKTQHGLFDEALRA